jgi:hypothetical protein
MPYKLRKAPKKELYWVSEIETNKKFSKLPIPLDKAKAQMRVLESALKGGIRIPRGMHNPSDEGEYDLEDEIERSINPRARELQPKAVRHPRPDDEPEGPEGPPPAKMSRTSGRSGRGKRGGFSPQDFIAYDKRHPTIPQSLNDTIPYGIARWYDLLTILSPTDKARISEKYGDRDILTEMNTRAKELLREHENRNRNRPQMSDLEYATKSQEFRIPLFEIIEEGKKEFPSYEEPVNYPGGSGKRKSKRKGGMTPEQRAKLEHDAKKLIGQINNHMGLSKYYFAANKSLQAGIDEDEIFDNDPKYIGNNLKSLKHLIAGLVDTPKYNDMLLSLGQIEPEKYEEEAKRIQIELEEARDAYRQLGGQGKPKKKKCHKCGKFKV